jgi:signal transduction histidine kinase/CheY-like chemotaxis protein
VSEARFGETPVRRALREYLSAAAHLSTLLAFGLLMLSWVGIVSYLELDRRKSLQAAIDGSSNLTRVFAEYVAGVIEGVDRNLLLLRHAREEDPAGFHLEAWTTDRHLLDDLVVQIATIGADGRLVATNVVRDALPVDLSDREHFRVHLDRSGDALFVSRPILGRTTGRWTIQLTRRLSRPDGSFDGVIVASIDPYFLSKFFDQIDLGRTGAVTLLGIDGLVRARSGLDPDLLGRSIAGTPFFEQITRETEGVYLGEGVLVGPRRLIAFRRLKQFPLVATVAMSQDEILADHLDKRRLFVAGGVGLTLFGLIAIGLGIGRQRRLDQARLAQRESERRALRKSQELEATLARMSQGILMVDGEERLRLVNRRAVELLGPSSELVVGRLVDGRITRLLGSAADGDGPRLLGLGPTEIELLTTPMPDGGRLHTLTDVTIHRQAQAVLAQARDRAEAAARTRTAFLATMSHELRTPLNGVVGIARLLEDCDTAAERDTYVRMLRNSAEHLLQIIEDILDLTRLEAGRVDLEWAPFDPRDVVAAAAGMVAAEARAKGLVLETEVAPDLPMLIGDSTRIRQVLLNLVGNAVKFTTSGRVVVRADRAVSTDPARPFALGLVVEDTGIGIAETDLGRLFVEFSQLDGSITRRFGGSGLGLAISRELVEKMGGSISVASRLGEGSVFTVVLPMSPADPAGSADAVPPAVDEPPVGLDILLAEDNPTNTLVATRLAEKMGHRVEAVVDGVEALAALDRRPFDLVLMDVMMPRMDGLTAIRAIRAGRGLVPEVPIVALTASALDEDHRAALDAGADAFATKPVSIEKLTVAIAEARAHRAGSAVDHAA